VVLPSGELWDSPHTEVTEAELVAWAADHVSEAAAAPKTVQILDTLPMTSVGKQFKPALRNLATRQVISDELATLGLTADISQKDGEVRLGRPADEAMAQKVADALNHYGFAWRFV
jgi:fatty-acyl-CoA synthase